MIADEASLSTKAYQHARKDLMIFKNEFQKRNESEVYGLEKRKESNIILDLKHIQRFV